MEIELTAAEQAQVKQAMDGLTAEVKTMDDAALKGLAAKIGVEAEKFPKRDDLETATLNKAHEDAIAGVKKIRAMDEEEAAMIATADDKRPEASRIIRRLHAEFTRDIPQDARGGVYEPDDDHPVFGGDHAVPDGKYRPAGADHIYQFKKKRLVSVYRADASNDYGGKGVQPVD